MVCALPSGYRVKQTLSLDFATNVFDSRTFLPMTTMVTNLIQLRLQLSYGKLKHLGGEPR